jgi:hypothetical protein
MHDLESSEIVQAALERILRETPTPTPLSRDGGGLTLDGRGSVTG